MAGGFVVEDPDSGWSAPGHERCPAHRPNALGLDFQYLAGMYRLMMRVTILPSWTVK